MFEKSKLFPENQQKMEHFELLMFPDSLRNFSVKILKNYTTQNDGPINKGDTLGGTESIARKTFVTIGSGGKVKRGI